MQKSDQINELAAAFAKAKCQFKPIIKTANNPFYKAKYAPLESVISATDAALSANGLSVIQLPESDGLTTILMHTSGQYISTLYPVNPVKNDPQGLGSAITYARRYSLSAILGVASEEDDDANAASKPVKALEEPQQEKSKPSKTERLALENQWNSRFNDYCVEAGLEPSLVDQCRDDWHQQHLDLVKVEEISDHTLAKLLAMPDKKRPERVNWIKSWAEARKALEVK